MRRASGKKISWSRTLRSLENLDVSEIHAQRLGAEEVLIPKNGDDDGETVAQALVFSKSWLSPERHSMILSFNAFHSMTAMRGTSVL